MRVKDVECHCVVRLRVGYQEGEAGLRDQMMNLSGVNMKGLWPSRRKV